MKPLSATPTCGLPASVSSTTKEIQPIYLPVLRLKEDGLMWVYLMKRLQCSNPKRKMLAVSILLMWQASQKLLPAEKKLTLPTCGFLRFLGRRIMTWP